ncbi:MAG TPA: hypothetical protein VE953_08495 [Terriglobales bacterium]|nr:hypothetical protein [Terriglobales bacterium]
MARPTKLTPAVEKLILDALRAGATRTAAFEAAGVERTQISRWLRRFATFRNAVTEAEANAELRAVITVRQAIVGGGWRAAAWWLEHRRRDEWGATHRVEIVHAVRDLARAVGVDEDAAILEAEAILKELRGGRA